MSPGEDSATLRPVLMAIGDGLRRPMQSSIADRSLQSAIARPGHTQEAEPPCPVLLGRRKSHVQGASGFRSSLPSGANSSAALTTVR